MQEKKLQQVTPWLVRAGSFSFQVQTRFPLLTVIVNRRDEKVMAELQASDYTNADIYSKPMHIATKFLKSEMAITIDGVPDPFRLQPNMKELPRALFDKYDHSTDPTTSADGNYVPSLLSPDAPCSNLMAGVTLLAPKPIKGDDSIPMFNAVQANRFDVYGGDDPKLPVTPSAQGTEFTPVPNWPPATAEQVRLAWSKAGTAVPSALEGVKDVDDGAKKGADSVEEAAPVETLVASFTKEWETIFGWPLDNVLDKKTQDLVQRPLNWQPPLEKLLLSEDTWAEYFVSEPRVGAQTVSSAA